jgi:hypothetical protein
MLIGQVVPGISEDHSTFVLASNNPRRKKALHFLETSGTNGSSSLF